MQESCMWHICVPLCAPCPPHSSHLPQDIWQKRRSRTTAATFKNHAWNCRYLEGLNLWSWVPSDCHAYITPIVDIIPVCISHWTCGTLRGNQLSTLLSVLDHDSQHLIPKILCVITPARIWTWKPPLSFGDRINILCRYHQTTNVLVTT